MARLPISGVTVSTPLRGEADLREVLVELCPEGDFRESNTKEFYRRLGRIIGRWSAEHYRLDISPLVKTFMAMRGDLEGIAKILSGHETGLREIHDIEVVSQLATILALDPEVGSRQQADELIDSFRHDAAKMAHACLIAAHGLKQQVGKSGRPPSDWYDDFTALLLEIAGNGGVEPQLGKDRITGAGYGWLLFRRSSHRRCALPTQPSPAQIRPKSAKADGPSAGNSLRAHGHPTAAEADLISAVGQNAKHSNRSAVGTVIADRPPPKSVQAEFPHTAPTLGA